MGQHHSQEYKEYVAKLIVEEGRKASQVAFELELSPKTVSRWVAAYRAKTTLGKPGENYLTPTELEKLKKQHEKEIQKLKEENEILKKAMHIFTKNQA
ncbi:transposase [Neobacillus rhizophilus]|uniref:Transposase n=1 Tax=Neobacillus rhizophilus TaxID=2833579 RepID=A0A942YY04_9BACI|nr:transposase [Neobacillus rhizophilus]MBS4214426.1 transposase [Neobacillus rhizophilus]MBS4216372.1 transposase [Neobacillus rhizophilus]MBS4216675.1 transposase [Neobacillus rhizophilus]